jgi:ribosome biogenesis GTPase A
VVYDSRGIEHGYVETGFLKDTAAFFEKLGSDKDLENHIHVVWYVLDLTQARFQPFEAEFCKDYLYDYPIIFVLNKADAVTLEVRNTMIKVIHDFHLQNCFGIFCTVANCKNFDTKQCKECHTTKIKKQLKDGNLNNN